MFNIRLHSTVMKVEWWKLRVYKWGWNPRARLLYPAAFLNERSSWGRCLSRCAELWTSRAIWSSSTPLNNTRLYGAQIQECNSVRDTESFFFTLRETTWGGLGGFITKGWGMYLVGDFIAGNRGALWNKLQLRLHKHELFFQSLTLLKIQVHFL